ncbi:MAG: pyridoxal-phosphate dependent enzyme, partial [Desulfobacterales bacterium]
MDIAQEVIAAERRIRPYIRNTILEYSPYYSKLAEADVHLKLENLQHTGSFKLRGAMNKMLSLSRIQRLRGVVTASTGNHGAAVAYGLKKLRATGIVFVPENASPAKVRTIEQLGAEVRHFGDDTADTEAQARSFAQKKDLTYIPPYNDLQVIGGQG